MTEDQAYRTLISQRELLCLVCRDRSSGNHYGVPTCDGCRGFFKRSVRKRALYVCKNEGRCRVDALRRNQCQACRFAKCLEVNMNPDAVQLQRESRAAGKRKMDDTHEGGESTPTKKKTTTTTTRTMTSMSDDPASSPGADSSMNSSENSEPEHEKRPLKPMKLEDRHPMFPDTDRFSFNPFNPFGSFNPFLTLPSSGPSLGLSCHSLFRPELTLALSRPGLATAAFLPPPPLPPAPFPPRSSEFPSGLSHCLSPVRGLPCLFFTCPLCYEKIVQTGSSLFGPAKRSRESEISADCKGHASP